MAENKRGRLGHTGGKTGSLLVNWQRGHEGNDPSTVVHGSQLRTVLGVDTYHIPPHVG